MERDSNGKPLIRHCANCKWLRDGFIHYHCEVKYKTVCLYEGRIKALFCRHFELRKE